MEVEGVVEVKMKVKVQWLTVQALSKLQTEKLMEFYQILMWHLLAMMSMETLDCL